MTEVEKLREENEKYRKALQEIADGCRDEHGDVNGHYMTYRQRAERALLIDKRPKE